MQEKAILRQSNLELLRIVAMFFIVLFHFNYHGGFDVENAAFSMNVYLLQCMQVFGKIGVNLFVLITGFFLIKSSFRWQKILNLWALTFFYSVAFALGFYFSKAEILTQFDLIQAFMPFIFNQYWFVSTYIVLYLCVPFINFILAKGQKIHLMLIVICLYFFCFLPSVTQDFYIFNFPNFWLFIMLYIMGAYLRLYPLKAMKNVRVNFVLSLVLFTLLFLIIGLYDWNGFVQKNYFFTYRGNSPLILLASIFIFQTFVYLKVPYCKWINWAASSMIGVYLIHDNMYLRPFLWQKLLKVSDSFQNATFFFEMFFVSLGVFIVCLFADKLRHYLLVKPFSFFVQKVNKKS